ncbi:hypothetical protein DFH29DRAFT_997397 [Suillus ampliporus]|nr:hypothetical protein DFH29DRAFT_997397 [Suillus ampliporus]
MVRPAIHKSVQAKIEATREKRRRYYAKDNILKRRRELHSSKSKESQAKAQEAAEISKEISKAVTIVFHREDLSESDNDSHDSSDSDENDRLSNLPECLLVIKDTKDKTSAMIGSDPCTFIKRILHDYVQTIMADNCSTKGDISIIETSMAKVQKLFDHAIPAQDQILNFCGISPEWHAADSVMRFLRTVLAYLEDILSLLVFGGPSELAEAEMLGELMYQKGIRI